MKKIPLLIIIAFFFISCQHENEDTKKLNISYFKDTSNSCNETTIGNNILFKPLKDSKLGNKNGWYWFKVQIETTEFITNEHLVFDIKGNAINAIEVYQNKKLISNLKKNINLSNIGIEITPGVNAPYYIKVFFEKQVHFPLKIYTRASYKQHVYNASFKNGMYYGFVLMIIIINLLFYSIFKELNFINYVFFLTLLAIGISDYDGVINLWLPRSFSRYITTILHISVSLSVIFFISNLLEYHKRIPKSIYISGTLFLITIILYSLFLYTGDYIYFAYADIINLIIFSYYIVLGILSLKKYPAAKYASVGYSLIWLSSIFFTIPLNWGNMIFSGLSIDYVKLGSLFEMLILTYAITRRVKTLQLENEKVHFEINEYINKLYFLKKNIKDTSTSIIEQKINELKEDCQLTEREVQVLLLILEEHTNIKIAEKLFISSNTVKFHTRNLYKKMNVKNKIQAIEIMHEGHLV